MAGCMAHAQNGHISTSGLKSDVTVVFLDPDFLWDEEISAIWPYKGYIVYFWWRMREMAVFPIFGLKSDVTIVSCFSTQISYKARKFQRFEYI